MPGESLESYEAAHDVHGLRRGRQHSPTVESICSSKLYEDRSQKRRRLGEIQHGETSVPQPSICESPSREDTATVEFTTRRRERDESATNLIEAQSRGYEQALQELNAAHQLALESRQQIIDAQEIAIETLQDTISILKGQMAEQTMAWLTKLSYPRSRQHQLLDKEIEPWMIQLQEKATEISDLVMKGWQKSSSSKQVPNVEREGDLLKLMSVVSGRMEILGVEEARSDYVIRSLIVASVSEWVFNDKFPDLTPDNHWKEFKILFAERAIENSSEDADKIFHEVVKAVEGFERDIRYRRSKNSDLINRVLPSRASKLAKRLASIFVEFLGHGKHKRRKGAKQNIDLAQVERSWLSQLNELFLNALNFVIRLRQREIDTIFEWPKKEAIFNDTMQALDSGSASLWASRHVALTVMPAAVLKVNGKSQVKLLRKSVVYLNISEQNGSSKKPRSLVQISEAANQGDAAQRLCACGRTFSNARGKAIHQYSCAEVGKQAKSKGKAISSKRRTTVKTVGRTKSRKRRVAAENRKYRDDDDQEETEGGQDDQEHKDDDGQEKTGEDDEDQEETDRGKKNQEDSEEEGDSQTEEGMQEDGIEVHKL